MSKSNDLTRATNKEELAIETVKKLKSIGFKVDVAIVHKIIRERAITINKAFADERDKIMFTGIGRFTIKPGRMEYLIRDGKLNKDNFKKNIHKFNIIDNV